MERLQIALENARRRRKSDNGLQAVVRTQTPPHSETWQGITSFVPEKKHLLKNHIALAAHDPGGKAIDMLRTRLLSRMRENGWKRVMITSPTSGCGKSTTAINLALALKRQVELKTLLFDFDLRWPAMAKLLGVVPEHGITDLLADKVSPQEQLLRFDDNLAISAGLKSAEDNLSREALKSKSVVAKIAALENLLTTDVTLFDMPPFLANDDAITTAAFADCALIIAAAGTTSIAQIDKTERELSQYTKIAGIIINKCSFFDRSSGDYDDVYY